MDAEKSIVIVVLSVLSICVVFVNTFCVVVIAKSKKLHSRPSAVFILSLITTHLIQGLLVLPFYALKRAKLPNPVIQKISCDGFRFTYMITFYGACINVLIISLDRFLAIKLLNTYKQQITMKRACYIIVIAWSYTLFLCLLPFAPLKKTLSTATSKCSYNQPKEWSIFMLLVNTLIPYIIITVIYTFVRTKVMRLGKVTDIHNIKRSDSAVDPHYKVSTTTKCSMIPVNDGSDKFRQRVFNVTFLIVLSYGITWAPSVIYHLLTLLTPSLFTKSYFNSTEEKYISFIIKVFTFLDAIGAPVIYCYHHDEFRQECRKIFAPKTDTTISLNMMRE